MQTEEWFECLKKAFDNKGHLQELVATVYQALANQEENDDFIITLSKLLAGYLERDDVPKIAQDIINPIRTSVVGKDFNI